MLIPDEIYWLHIAAPFYCNSIEVKSVSPTRKASFLR